MKSGMGMMRHFRFGWDGCSPEITGIIPSGDWENKKRKKILTEKTSEREQKERSLKRQAKD